MAVAHSAASESHTGTTGSTNQASFNWTHTQTGTPQGVLVFVHTISATDTVSTVTYGSVTLTRVPGGAAIDSAGEPGRTDLFFAGTGLGTGNQTITVNRTNNATVMYAAAATVTALTDVNIANIVLLQGDGTLTVQSVTDGEAPTDSLRYAGAYSGLNAVPSAGTGSTNLTSIDLGNFTCSMVRETTAGTGARNVGFSATQNDDRAIVHVAVRELWDRDLNQTVGTFTLTGNDVVLTVSQSETLPAEVGSFSFIGNNATLSKQNKLETQTEQFSLTGFDATLLHTYLLEANKGSFTLTGFTALLAVNRTLLVELGTYLLNGNNAVFKRTWELQADKAQFSLTGKNVILTKAEASTLVALVGAFTLSGKTTTLLKDYVLTCTKEEFILTGNDLELTTQRTLSGTKGVFNLIGRDASLTYDQVIDAETGVIALTGNNITFTKTKQLTAVTTAFTLTGLDASVSHGRLITVEAGVFTLTGNTVTLIKNQKELIAEKGTFSLMGLNADLTKQGNARRRIVFIF